MTTYGDKSGSIRKYRGESQLTETYIKTQLPYLVCKTRGNKKKGKRRTPVIDISRMEAHRRE